ncbi:MAG: RNA-directed DNA polymerase [Planctomycetes bacterium]|nr:RNA-directed DNA polymerase [Planctomycetota bacterium]
MTLLGQMSKDLLVPKGGLVYLMRSAPHRYKVFPIPKHSGKGQRIIAQPAREVKRLQYWVIKNLFPRLEIHPAATAYIHGRNIRYNTEIHSQLPYILKLDLKDYFPSLKGDDFKRYASNHSGLSLSDEEVDHLVRLLFWQRDKDSQLQLSIGAPSSPGLSNALMYSFDSEIFSFCNANGINYTRYADDMAFSMREKEKRGDALRKVTEILEVMESPKLHINDGKTVFGSKAHRRMLTGLILTNDGRVSLGREKKRRIRSQIYHFIKGDLSDTKRQYLQGMLSFSKDVEPEFIRRMEKKYGIETLNSI